MEAIYFRVRKISVQRVTVVKFRVGNIGSDGAGCFRVKISTDTTELTDMRIARKLRKW